MEIIIQNYANSKIISIKGFRSFDSFINVVLTFEFGHEFTLLKLENFE